MTPEEEAAWERAARAGTLELDWRRRPRRVIVDHTVTCASCGRQFTLRGATYENRASGSLSGKLFCSGGVRARHCAVTVARLQRRAWELAQDGVPKKAIARELNISLTSAYEWTR